MNWIVSKILITTSPALPAISLHSHALHGIYFLLGYCDNPIFSINATNLGSERRLSKLRFVLILGSHVVPFADSKPFSRQSNAFSFSPIIAYRFAKRL